MTSTWTARRIIEYGIVIILLGVLAGALDDFIGSTERSDWLGPLQWATTVVGAGLILWGLVAKAVEVGVRSGRS